ncbi:MAG: polyhydroxyalkanoate depolymerase [Novosphingobium sp.]
MLYHAYEMQRAFMQGASVLAAVTAEMLSNPRNPIGYFGLGPVAASALDVFAHAAATRGKPGFGIDDVSVEGKTYRVTESLVLHKPFGSLVRFTREGLGKDAPRLMIVAPMSGHYATLLRGTVERMVESCEVYITDWADAKLVPLSEGRFDLDDYIDYVIEFFEHIGPGAHAMAVCQPSVPTLAATAVMGATKNPCRPVTLTLMGGPIDTRASPTAVNTIADQRPMSWFRHNVIATVPLQYPGAGREVYPGFLQLTSFMAMNLGNHIMSHYEMFKHLVVGDDESAEATKEFYDEYRAVCDMTAEFYLQTVEHVFQKQSLAKGELMHRGNLIDIGKITDTAILAIEGERDDISGIGQTRAALDLATNLPDNLKRYMLAKNVGHYGIFNGSKWRTRIAPVVEEWIGMKRKPKLEAVA